MGARALEEFRDVSFLPSLGAGVVGVSALAVSEHAAVNDPPPADHLGGDGQVQEFVAADSLMVPKGFTGTWQMLGNYRELIVVERESYENASKTEEK